LDQAVAPCGGKASRAMSELWIIGFFILGAATLCTALVPVVAFSWWLSEKLGDDNKHGAVRRMAANMVAVFVIVLIGFSLDGLLLFGMAYVIGHSP
jgi:hypothetical protein